MPVAKIENRYTDVDVDRRMRAKVELKRTPEDSVYLFDTLSRELDERIRDALMELAVEKEVYEFIYLGTSEIIYRTDGTAYVWASAIPATEGNIHHG
jgi:hypothetical protein